MESIIQVLQTITGVTFSIGLFFLALAFVYFRRSRRGAYWRQRRQAGDRGLQCAIATTFFLIASAAFCLITVTVTYVERQDEDGDEASLAESSTLTPEPSESVAPTREIIATEAITPEETPEIEAEAEAETEAALETDITDSPATQTPSATAVQTQTSVFLEITALDDVISDTLNAIQPGTQFPPTTQRIYVFFDYRDMTPGTVWKQILLRDGSIVQQQTQRWGVLPQEGSSFFFFGSSEGFAPGAYEVQITLGEEDTLLTSFQFTIQ